MLVLGRKRNETIVINGNITIQILDIRGEQVRVGVEAPKDVPVHRGEIQKRIEREKVESS